MSFKYFIEQGQVKKASLDRPLVRSLVTTADSDLQFLDSIEINVNSARKVMSNYYDVLRGIIEAIGIVNGYKIYYHKAFTYF